MDELEAIKQKYAAKTEISAAEYSVARESLSKEEFECSYLKVWVNDTVCKYYQVGRFNQEDATLLLLEKIRQNTRDSKRYLKYLWYFIVVNICIGVALLLIVIFV